MLYAEFLEGTGCRNNDHNYKVYRRLEIVYMNDESMSKEEVYEWGKKLADNSLTEEQLIWNKYQREQIAKHKEMMQEAKEFVDRYKAHAKQATNTEDRVYWNGEVKWWQDRVNFNKREIAFRKAQIIK